LRIVLVLIEFGALRFGQTFAEFEVKDLVAKFLGGNDLFCRLGEVRRIFAFGSG
jgi:hypothetical protein